MKKRVGFVSNSSSSSFIIFKDALSKKRLDMVVNYQDWIKFFIELDEKKNEPENLINKFSYYDTDPWQIKVEDDFIFGETSMDNFSISDYFSHINIKPKYIKWDDGYNTEPFYSQLEFIKKMKKKQRKRKIKKINKKNK